MSKMICVCETHGKKCKEHGFEVKVKGTDYIFCCEKGFKKSLKDFIKYDPMNIGEIHTDYFGWKMKLDTIERVTIMNTDIPNS